MGSQLCTRHRPQVLSSSSWSNRERQVNVAMPVMSVWWGRTDGTHRRELLVLHSGTDGAGGPGEGRRKKGVRCWIQDRKQHLEARASDGTGAEPQAGAEHFQGLAGLLHSSGIRVSGRVFHCTRIPLVHQS